MDKIFHFLFNNHSAHIVKVLRGSYRVFSTTRRATHFIQC